MKLCPVAGLATVQLNRGRVRQHQVVPAALKGQRGVTRQIPKSCDSGYFIRRESLVVPTTLGGLVVQRLKRRRVDASHLCQFLADRRIQNLPS